MTTHHIGSFLLIVFISVNLNCKNENLPTEPQPTAADTTNHNFTWTEFTFGDNYQASHFKDVAIINDSDIWVVGEVYLGESYINDSIRNAVHWDGRSWQLKQILFTGSLSGGIHYPPVRSIVAFNNHSFFVTNGGIGAWVENENVTMDDKVNAILRGGIYKLFATSSHNIYAVGGTGAIVHYDGSSWMSLESGTSIDLRDVWGTADGKTVWASGYSNDYSKCILLKYDGIHWQTIWERANGNQIPPFNGLVASVWSSKDYLFLTGASGVFRCNLSSDTTTVQKQSIDPIRASYAIRGTTTGNSIAVVYDDGIIWHYDGATWYQVHTLTPDKKLVAVAVSKNTVVAVGTDNTTGKALIYMGKH